MINEKLNKDILDLINEEKNEINEIDNKLLKIGKLLWTGSFSSGSIIVDELSNYTMIMVMLNSVPCIGTLSRGIGGIGTYTSHGISHAAYRFKVDGNKLTINGEDTGGTNGSSNEPVTAIYGLF